MDDFDIIKNIKDKFINNKNHKFDYTNRICLKVWGYEFLAFESDKIGIWMLKINKNMKTSIHTHFNKDTLLIVLNGTVKINMLNDKYEILSVMDKMFIPKYKFHGIEAITDNVELMEIEIFNSNVSFSDKNDLYRLYDNYNRDSTNYENFIQVSYELDKYNYFYIDELLSLKKDYMRLINDINDIHLRDNTIYILLKGVVYSNGLYIKEGSIINTTDLSIIDDIMILEISIPYANENRKIIYNFEHLNLIINKLKDKKNILTSGCYDLIHIGHLELLKNAKLLGDNLFVCLSSDKQIKSLKGKDRPINNYNDRINLFKTISYVDYIIIYDEEDIENEKTLDKIMNIVRPHYWVKGSDYNEADIKNKHPTVNIRLFKNIEDISTTNIIKNIKNK